MRISVLISTLVLSTAMLLPQPASARDSVKDRLQHQKQRIRQGVRNGSLTPAEARRLRHQHRRLVRQRRYLRRSNGGHMTQAEKNAMQRELNHTSGRIGAERHDYQRR